MTESVVTDEKAQFGLPSINPTAFTESPMFHVYSSQGLSLLYLCWLGISPYRAKSLESLHASPNHCLLI